MRRSLILLFLIVAGASLLYAQPFDPFQPTNPVVMGRGGSFTATASGFNSFFYNPAGFARDGELTLVSANPWAFMNQDTVTLARDYLGQLVPWLAPSAEASASLSSRALDMDALAGLEGYFTELSDWAEATDPQDLEDILIDATGDAGIDITSESDLAEIIATAGTQDVIDFLEAVEQAASDAGNPLPFTVDQLEAAIAAALPAGYLKVGAMAGMGYLGNGIGLGLFANVEGVVDGTNILQASGTVFNTITFVGGFGLSFGRLHAGVSIRPIIFGYSEVAAAPILTGFLAGGELDVAAIFANAVYFGSGMGLDAGLLYELGPLSLGLGLKDLFGTRIGYRSTTFDEYRAALLAASLPLGTELTSEEEANAWTIPMKVNLGAQFHPNLGVASFLFDPSVSVDLLDVTSVVRTLQAGEAITGEDILAMLNFGVEINTMKFLSLRGGYYGGYISGGLGLNLYVAQINAAIAGDFGRDEADAWGFTNVGGSIEVALRVRSQDWQSSAARQRAVLPR